MIPKSSLLKKSKNYYGFLPLASYIVGKAAKAGVQNKISWRFVGGMPIGGIGARCALTIFVILALSGHCSAASAEKPSDLPQYDVNVPLLNAAEALNRLAKQTGAALLFPYDVAEARQANSIAGRYSLMEALELLLQDSGLSSGLSDNGVIAIFLVGERENNNHEEGVMKRSNTSITKKLPVYLMSAVAASTAMGQESDAAVEDEGDFKGNVIETIVVTAQKRKATDVQDIAMSVKALGQSQLEDMGVAEFEDFYRHVPGLSVLDGGPGLKKYYIRGVSLPGSIPTVGQYVDEWLTSTHNEGAQFDSKIFDVNRVEVLKGPQGTLYGASAMGGIVRIISNKPDATQTEFGLEADLSSTDYADGNNSAVKGMINVPLIDDELAFRGSASYYDNSGWIENVVTGEDGINFNKTLNVRGALLWQPTDDVTLEAIAMYQESDFGSEQKVIANLAGSDGISYGAFGEAFGIADVQGTSGTGSVGDFQTAKYVSDQASDKWYGLSLRGEVNFDDFTMTGIGTYARRDATEDEDFWNLGGYVGPGAIYRRRAIDDTTTFELRFASTGDDRFNWQGGYYYEKFTIGNPGSYITNGMSANGSVFEMQRDACLDAFAAGGAAAIAGSNCFLLIPTIQPEGSPGTPFSFVDQPCLAGTSGSSQGLIPTCSNLLVSIAEKDRVQHAVFGEAVFDLTDNMELTYGARYYNLAAEIGGNVALIDLFDEYGFRPKQDLEDENGIIHKASVSYEFNENMMAFFLFSQGYRQGGENTPDEILNFPATFGTDSTDSFELGFKSLLFDDRLQLNVTGYLININDIQTRLQRCVEGRCRRYTDNVGNARSMGVEVDVAIALGDSWTVTAAVNRGRSELAEDSEAAVPSDPDITPNPSAGFKGDPLPNSPELMGAVSITYSNEMEFSGASVPVFGNLSWTYTGESTTEFNEFNSSYFENDSYTETRLRLGFEYEDWKVSFYVNNLLNQVNDLGSRPRRFARNREITVNRPRTVGLNVALKF